MDSFNSSYSNPSFLNFGKSTKNKIIKVKVEYILDISIPSHNLSKLPYLIFNIYITKLPK